MWFSATTADTDHGLKRINADLKKLRKRSVKIGIMGGGEAVEGVAVVDYAFYNEFGTSTIPARPFMSETYDRHGEKEIKFAEFLYGKLLDGEFDAEHLLNTLGLDYQKKVQKTIRAAKSWAVPNADSTIAEKGSSSPLIDTGRMVQSVRYEVE